MRIAEKLPNIYDQLMPVLTQKSVPKESVATCDNCTLAMSPKSIQKSTKCCSYYPQLPNYLIGGLLKDEKYNLDEGQKRAYELINRKTGISPYGMSKPVWYKTLRKQTILNPDFVKTETSMVNLLCPFYGQKGECHIWAYREHCCSTHFCFSVGGTKGKVFWSVFMKFMKRVEIVLAGYCIENLGLHMDVSLATVTSEYFNCDDVDKNISELKYKELWGQWIGNEVEFYKKSFELIQKMTADEFEKVLEKKELLSLYSEVEENLKVFNLSVLPKIPIWNSSTVVEVENDIVTLILDKGFYDISIVKLPIIQAFNGVRTLEEVMHKAYALNIFLEKDIYKLFDLGVLKAVD